VTCSDSSGYIFDEAGIDREKLAYLMNLKNMRRGRVKEYAEKYPSAVYTETHPDEAFNPLWNHQADCAFPSATQNEINARDAQNLVDNGVDVVSEGANMPTVPEGIDIFIENRLLYGPGKAANAGGVSVSGLEMTQNSMRLSLDARGGGHAAADDHEEHSPDLPGGGRAVRHAGQLHERGQYRRLRQGGGRHDRPGGGVGFKMMVFGRCYLSSRYIHTASSLWLFQ
jgi:hypothetical protein